MLQASQSDLAVRPSGIIVPRALEAAPEAPISATLDADGRRRVVLTTEERKTVLRAITILEDHGFATLIRCQEKALEVKRHGRLRIIRPHVSACGEILRQEGIGSPDAGSGCTCSRIHLNG